MQQLMEHERYGVMPAVGGFQRSTFWTKRRKTAASLVTVVAMLVGVAIAFKLFDQTISNNVVRDAATFNYNILKRDAVLGETSFVPASNTNPIFKTNLQTGQPSFFPGDSRRVDVQLENAHDPGKDASFTVRVGKIFVHDFSNLAAPKFIPQSDPRWAEFVSFFSLKVEKERILQVNGQFVKVEATEREANRFAVACDGQLEDINSDAPCELGVVRGKGARDIRNDRLDIRNYRFFVTEADTGGDQSAFKGWLIDFELIFNARVPAASDDVVIVGER